MKLHLPLIAAALVTLAGCAPTPPAPRLAPVPPPASLPPITYDGETLGDLLIAEDAAQRQALDLALAYYGNAARTTRDPRVMEEAASLANYLGYPQRTRKLSSRWLKREPNNPDALRFAALAAVQLNHSDTATQYLDRLIAAHGSDALRPLIVEARHLDDREHRELLAALSDLADRYPQEPALWYARALHERLQGHLDAALDAARRAHEQRPDHIDTRLLVAQLMFEQGNHSQALGHLHDWLADYEQGDRDNSAEDGEPQVRIAYIRLLLTSGDTATAQEQLRILARNHPDDPDLQYSLALIALESDAPQAAGTILKDLLAKGYRHNEVLLHLGRIAEMRNKPDVAIDYYRQVEGVNYLPAHLQAARLLYATGRSAAGHALITTLINTHPQQASALVISEAVMRTNSGDAEGALALLDRSLSAEPNNVDLLYARAMTAAALQRYPQMEQDLTRVLDIQPDNAAALNALGYTWADRGVHLQKAHDMIQRALRQEPENPAFLDSMGWVLYRLGRLDQALTYLRQAHEAMPDPEVAAHLGEVLWMNDEKEQARRVWRAGLRAKPKAPSIKETLQRLEVRL